MEKRDDLFSKSYIIAILALFSCLMWGSAVPTIKIGYKLFEISGDETFHKILFAGFRFFIAGMMILIISVLSGKSIKIYRNEIRRVSLLGLLQTAIHYTLFYIGLSNTSGTKGSIMTATGTLFPVILAHFFYREDKLNNKKIIGLIMGFAGVIIVNLNGARLGGGFTLTGEGFVMITGLTGAFSAIYTKKIAGFIDTFLVTGYQLVIGSLFLILVGYFGGARLEFTNQNIWLLLYLAFASASAFSIWTILLKYNGVGRVSIYRFTIPLFGTFLSYILLDERLLGPNVILSIALVSISIILINIDGVISDKTLE